MQTKSLFLGLTAIAIAVTSVTGPSFAAKGRPSPEQRAERMIQMLDTNKDGKVSLAEAEAGASIAFASFDANKDGQVSRDEIKARREAVREAQKAVRDARKAGGDQAEARAKLKDMRPVVMPGMGPKMFERADVDKNGALSLAEVTAVVGERFKSRDTNGDGFFDVGDLTKKI